MKRLQTRFRYIIYGALLLVLVSAAAISLRFVSSTGAYLTDEGDWQSLAGDYRIGVIDYTVDINGETLIAQGAGSDLVQQYQMVVPISGGVRMFDSTLTNPATREKEFNEGATLVRVRIINHSDSLVDVNATFTFLNNPNNHLRVLPLPTELDNTMAHRLNYRKYVMSTLAMAEPAALTTLAQETAALTDLAALYKTYYNDEPPLVRLAAGILSGASDDKPIDGDFVQDSTTGAYYYYKDIFFLVWSEYGEGEYNAATLPADQTAAPRNGNFHGVFSVGQVF